MNLIKTVFRNTLALSIANVSSKAITASVGILLARYLGAERFGEYSVAIAFATVFVALTDLGFGQIIVREGSRNPESISIHVSNLCLRVFLKDMILEIREKGFTNPCSC